MMFCLILSFFASLTFQPAGAPRVVSEKVYAGLSGIAWINDRQYAVVCDGTGGGVNASRLHHLTVSSDDKGVLLDPPVLSKGLVLEGVEDVEGIAYDPWSKQIWIAAEADASIREFNLQTGKQTGRRVNMPPLFAKAARWNYSLESLAISRDGTTLWTANEEALTCDGPKSTIRKGSLVRLVKFTRTKSAPDWKLAGMWAYRCSPIGAIKPVKSGVSDLCVLPDNSLLVLERECSMETLGRTRLYRPDFSRATDISKFLSLENATFTPVTRGPVLCELKDGAAEDLQNFSVVFYEGLCWGPRNKDGSLSLLLVADGGPIQKKSFKLFTVTVRTRAGIRALRLEGL